MAKQWGGRFSKETNRAAELFTESLSVDWRLFKEDIAGSIAYAYALKEAGVLSASECSKIKTALRTINKALEENKLLLKPEFEDIHTFVEQELIKKVGEAGKKLHTGRSRNDQVVTDLRIYLKKKIAEQIGLLDALRRILVWQAEQNIDTVMPGYTHLQKAQPILLAHYFLAHFEKISRDISRFNFSYYHADVLPLGSGALAGTPYKIDRQKLAKLLGFSKISENSLDAISDRDFILDYLFAAATLFVHLSRLCEDIIIWNSSEFGFVEIDDAFATGSSLMPHKKNPDVAELTRGKSGSVIGSLVSMLTILKGLPLSYNRDLQEDKKVLFTVVDSIDITLITVSLMIKTLNFNTACLKNATETDYLTATDLADYLVAKGVAFRTAHSLVGKIVNYAAKQKKQLADLSLVELKKFSKLIGEDVYQAISVKESIECRQTLGGTSPRAVKMAIKKAKKHLSTKK